MARCIIRVHRKDNDNDITPTKVLSSPNIQVEYVTEDKIRYKSSIIKPEKRNKLKINI